MTISTYSVTSTSPTAVYTSGGNTAVTFMSFCNYSGAELASVDVYVVPYGNTYGPTNQLYSSLQLTENDTYQLYLGGEKLILSNGDMIQVATNGANVAVITSYTSI